MDEQLYNEMKRVLNSIHNNAKSAHWMGFTISPEMVAEKIEELADDYPELTLDLYETE